MSNSNFYILTFLNSTWQQFLNSPQQQWFIHLNYARLNNPPEKQYRLLRKGREEEGKRRKQIEGKIRITRQSSRDLSGPFLSQPLSLVQFIGWSLHMHNQLFSKFSEVDWGVFCFQSHSLCQRCKCNAVSNLGLEIFIQEKEAGPRKAPSSLCKNLFSNCTLSGWHGNIAFLFCQVFEIFTLSGFQSLKQTFPNCLKEGKSPKHFRA